MLLTLAALTAYVPAAVVSADDSAAAREKRQGQGPPIPPTPEDCFFSATYADQDFLDCHGLGRFVIRGSPEFCACRQTFEQHATDCGADVETICPPSVPPPPTYGGSPGECLQLSLDFQSCLFSSSYTGRDSTDVFCSECKSISRDMVRVCLPRLNAHLETWILQNICARSENRTTVSVETPATLNVTCLHSATSRLIPCLSASFDSSAGGDNGRVFCQDCRSQVEENARACFGETATDNLHSLDAICQTIPSG